MQEETRHVIYHLNKKKITYIDTWYLLIYFLRYLGQKTAKEPFRSSSQAATCYYQL